MRAAYSTMLRHIRQREDAYQAILHSINCLTTTEKGTAISIVGVGAVRVGSLYFSPFGQLGRKHTRLIFLSLSPPLSRPLLSIFKIQKLRKITPTWKAHTLYQSTVLQVSPWFPLLQKNGLCKALVSTWVHLPWGRKGAMGRNCDNSYFKILPFFKFQISCTFYNIHKILGSGKYI